MGRDTTVTAKPAKDCRFSDIYQQICFLNSSLSLINRCA